MLKEYCGTWKETQHNRIKDAVSIERQVRLSIARQSRLHREVKRTFPKEISGTIWMTDSGANGVKAIIELPEDAPAEHTILVRRYLAKRYHKAERNFNDCDGTFTWSGSAIRTDRKGKYREEIRFDNTSAGNCKIIKYKETVTRFKTDCK